MNDTNAKQQIVDRIKKSSTILVTVSSSPSVDELSAALGLTILLNKMDKHATAVVSGEIPPAIAFLDPEKTFEGTVDSLRDFIIALDKSKADHLRYKVDGEVVKIFITPYRTTITSDDLDFSQGDYNVELVLALGVKNKDHLDTALAAHGRILHDATVATISAGGEKSELGSIDWSDAGASSLSEMLVGLVDALKLDKSMMDEQIATAFMTGIVAATDRFSNNRTSSRVMTMAAQLMTAGANQQLIALRLGDTSDTSSSSDDSSSVDNDASGDNADGTTDLAEGAPTKLKKTKKAKQAAAEDEAPATANDGALTIHHENALEEAARETLEKQQAAARERAEAELKERTAGRQKLVDADQALADQLATVVPPSPAIAQVATADVSGEEPTMGGTLNATTEQAADDNRRELLESRNHTILSHAGEYIGDNAPSFQSPLNAASAPNADNEGDADLFQESVAPAGGTTLRAAPIQPPQAVTPPEPTAPPAPTPVEPPSLPPIPEPVVAPEPSQPPAQTLAEIDAQHRAPREHEEARAAVEAAFGAVPYEPVPSPTYEAAPIPAPATPPAAAPLAPPPMPPLPPMPDFSTLPPLPPEAPAPSFGDAQPPAPPAPPADPGQFRIPGQ